MAKKQLEVSEEEKLEVPEGSRPGSALQARLDRIKQEFFDDQKRLHLTKKPEPTFNLKTTAPVDASESSGKKKSPKRIKLVTSMRESGKP